MLRWDCRDMRLGMALRGQGLRPVELVCERRSKEQLLDWSAHALLTESEG